MAKMTRVSGVREVLQNMLRANKDIARNVARGLKRAGLFLQRESMKIVPIDTSALKNSAFTRATGMGMSTDVIVGYTTLYAVYVHERMDLRHALGKEAKYLEKPARERREQILAIIYQEGAKRP